MAFILDVLQFQELDDKAQRKTLVVNYTIEKHRNYPIYDVAIAVIDVWCK